MLLRHLDPVDACDAQCFDVVVQLSGVLGGDDDAARCHPDPERQHGRRFGLSQPEPEQNARHLDVGRGADGDFCRRGRF